MKHNSSVLSTVREMIAKELCVSKESIQANTSIDNEFEIDSLDKLRILVAIEVKFNITIKDSEENKLLKNMTPLKIANYISEHLSIEEVK